MMINTVKVHFLGNILGRGARGVGKQCSGKITKAANAAEARHLLSIGKIDILLIHTITEDMADILPQVKGCILEIRSRMSPEAILTANPAIAVVADVERALEHYENGQYVSLDGVEKIIYEGLIQS